MNVPIILCESDKESRGNKVDYLVNRLTVGITYKTQCASSYTFYELGIVIVSEHLKLSKDFPFNNISTVYRR